MFEENKVKISIIVPAYNVEKYIVRTIESLKKQTLKEMEIIVINDGSTDSTGKILEEIARSDKRIKVINKENGGVTSARNIGIKESSGEYISYLDGDDWIQKEAYEEMYNLAKKEGADIVIADYFEDDDLGNLKYKKEYKNNYYNSSKDEYLEAFFRAEGDPSIWNKIYKRDLYIKNDMIINEKLRIGEDLVTLSKLMLKAKKICKINKAYVHYIKNNNSLSRDKCALKYDSLFLAFDEIERYYIENGVIEEWKSSILKLKTRRILGFIGKNPYFNNEKYNENLDQVYNFLQEKNILQNMSLLKFHEKILCLFCHFLKKNFLKVVIKLCSSYIKSKK